MPLPPPPKALTLPRNELQDRCSLGLETSDIAAVPYCSCYLAFGRRVTPDRLNVCRCCSREDAFGNKPMINKAVARC